MYSTLTVAIPEVAEAEIPLLLNGVPYQTFHCTPEALHELVAGHLFCRGMICSAAELELEITGNAADRTLSLAARTLNNTAAHFSSTCKISPPSIEFIRQNMDRMNALAHKYRVHGGVHCAALFRGQELVACFEDVGRHNAFDKIIGSSLIQGLNPAGLTYFSSGRVNSEIAVKAAACRLALIVSRSVATSEACRIASESNFGIIGRIESTDPLLFCRCGAYEKEEISSSRQ